MIKHIKIDANECTCERCHKVWVPKPVKEGSKWVTPVPIACAACKSPYWQIKPQREK